MSYDYDDLARLEQELFDYEATEKAAPEDAHEMGAAEYGARLHNDLHWSFDLTLTDTELGYRKHLGAFSATRVG